MTSLGNPHYVVFGGLGFVGQRLAEMLVERETGCTVDAVDARSATPAEAADAAHDYGGRLNFRVCDITCGVSAVSPHLVDKAVSCVFNCAAVVGPYHPQDLYDRVNHLGAANIVSACRQAGVKKLVFIATPSSRFDPYNLDICGKGVRDLPFPDQMDPPRPFVAEYARTKALGERATLAASCSSSSESTPTPSSSSLLTVSVAPHQVYGPRDRLMLPNVLAAGRSHRLRVFGPGQNRIDMIFVDNFCHALMLAESALAPGSPVLGRSYIVTDDAPCNFWKTANNAIVALYGQEASIFTRYSVPAWLIMSVAKICDAAAWLLARPPFKLNSFAVKMLLINRYFDIEDAKRDLGYAPVVPPKEAWSRTIEWWRKNPPPP